VFIVMSHREPPKRDVEVIGFELRGNPQPSTAEKQVANANYSST